MEIHVPPAMKATLIAPTSKICVKYPEYTHIRNISKEDTHKMHKIFIKL